MAGIRRGATDHLPTEGLECFQGGMLARQPVVKPARDALSSQESNYLQHVGIAFVIKFETDL